MELSRVEAPATDTIRSGTGVANPALMSKPAPPVVASARPMAARSTGRIPQDDECLVRDLRADLSPAQCVERRLAALLKDAAVPASHVRIAAHLCRKS